MNGSLYPTSAVPFSIVISDLGLPSPGVAEVTSDRFFLIPADISIDRMFVYIQGTVTNSRSGSLTFGVVQWANDGEVREIIPQLALTGSDQGPHELGGQTNRIDVGRPLYLRSIASCPSSASAAWYASTNLQLNGTVHFVVDQEA